mgnify:CR=1 FL=1
MLIDAEQLTHYQRCHRRAYLDAYGDASQRDAPNEYLMKLIQDSQVNQRRFVEQQACIQPHYPPGDWAAAAAATVALMQQGVEQIFQGVLLAKGPLGVTLKSNPDLLVRCPGRSDFGDWLYVPMEIKLGKRPKAEYQVATAFHTLVTAQVQGAWPEEAWLLLREGKTFTVDLWEVLPRMQEILEGCVQTLVGRVEPDVFITRSRCSLCHWLNHCHAIAKADHHLSLLPGVTPSRYVQLQNLNLTTVRSLAELNPLAIETLPGFGKDTAHKLVRQAQATLHNRAILIESAAHSPASPPAFKNRVGAAPYYPHPLLAALDIPTAPVELYFDIEAEPSLNLAYLHGVVVVDRVANTQDFYPLLAEHPDDEMAVWRQFLDLAAQYPTAPIFHFCPYEAQTVERLAKLYGPFSHRIDALLRRFVDLHDRITRTVTLPVESYALKPIARWLGFDWRDPAANGAQSICWYSQWLTTRDRAYLDSILTYNEDDCRATHRVKDWLVGFLMEAAAIEAAELA